MLYDGRDKVRRNDIDIFNAVVMICVNHDNAIEMLRGRATEKESGVWERGRETEIMQRFLMRLIDWCVVQPRSERKT